MSTFPFSINKILVVSTVDGKLNEDKEEKLCEFFGISLGVLFGLILDFVYGKVIGTTAVMLCVIGYLGSYFDKNFSKENKKVLPKKEAPFLFFIPSLLICKSSYIKYNNC